MKKLLLLTFIISAFGVSAQSVNNYKYILVPDKFSDFKENQYQLNYYLKKLLRQGNFTVLNEHVKTWPEEVRQNPCMVLKADLNKKKKLIKNGVELTFKDCYGVVNGSFRGISEIKDFDKGYQDALNQAMQQAGKYDSVKSNTTSIPFNTNDEISENNSGLDSVFESSTVFKNENQLVILTPVKTGSYLLYDKKDLTLIAQLQPTSRDGIFQVTVLNSEQKYTTVGFLDDENLSIDFMNKGKKETTDFKIVK